MPQESASNDGVFVLAPVVQRYLFAKPLQGDDAREICKAVKGRVAQDFKNAPAFNMYFKFNEETGQINGSNIFYGILVNDELGKSGLWIPTIVQAKQLDAAGKLSNNVYRDFGIVIYNSQGSNAKIAEVLMKEAAKRRWEAPILAPFRALTLRESKNEYGASIGFSENPQDIMNGEEAKVFLQTQINYFGSLGALRLYRGNLGSWFAYGSSLADSHDHGRVDFACGEATAKNLESAVIEEINKAGQRDIQRINDKVTEAREAGLNVLRS